MCQRAFPAKPRLHLDAPEHKLHGATRLAAAEPSAPQTSARAAATQKPVAKKATSIQHPMAELGGYKMPSVGNIGGAKGIGVAGGGVKKRTKQSDSGVASKASKPVSKEEADAIAAREAAKKRVQQRTLSTFGLG